MAGDLATALFDPTSVALVGASPDVSKPNGRPLKYLSCHGYRGDIHPVNPSHAEIGGLRCYPRLEDIERPVDHAFIMVAAPESIASTIRSCGAAGVRCATILAGGFAETGVEGKEHQEQLLAIARESGVRILGPNSIGMINPASGLALSASAVLELPGLSPGSAAVISQSGSLIGAILSHGEARDTGFSKLVSVGNELDLSVGEVGSLLLDDDATETILLFLETLRRRDLLIAFAQKAARLGKPLIAYHVGRSELGRRIAQTHTGALTTSEKAIGAFLADYGIAQVGTIESFVESPRLFAGRSPLEPGATCGVAVATTSGGGGTMVIDSLAQSRVRVLEPPPRAKERLRRLGIVQDQAHMVDLTLAGARPEIVHAVIGDLLGSEHASAVVMVVGSSAQFHPDLAVEPLTAWAGQEKPLLVYLVPEAAASQRMLTRVGIPAFRSAEACAEALRALLSWKSPQPTDNGVRSVVLNLPAVEGTLPEADALCFFEALGIETASRALAADGRQASRIAAQIGFPVALKIVSSDIPHKSDVGGVRLNVADARSAARECDLIVGQVGASAPDARVRGVLVQAMIEGCVEAIVAYRRDPVAGPLIMLGVGGTMAELYDDTAFAVAPVTPEAARGMVARVKGLAPLTGYRGGAKGDVAALVRAIVAISGLARHPSVAEAEINPLIVREEGRGAVAVDGLVVGADETMAAC